MTTQSWRAWRPVVAAMITGALAGTATAHWWHQYGPGYAARAADRRRLARAHQQHMHWELLNKAIDDPELAVVIDNYGRDLSPERRRQYLYANLWYVNAFHLYEAGVLDRRQLRGHLRELFQSAYIREYWEATRPHRASLDPNSTEAEVGAIAETLLQERDESDTDEWWVVGEPPPL
ncbi:DUF6082 family protein [Streptomyces sp. NPDC046939]|uniref:DUF6082 family protein n=1 Tax=Streptomyces sp. NPDC046939 TaxID=3155376 RepID=UPI0033FD2FF4